MIRLLTFLFLIPFYLVANETFSDEWQKKVNKVLSQTLTRYHYVDQSINDNFSKRIYQLFLNQLDPNKNFFTENQMIELNSYEYKIDNDIRNNTFYFYKLAILRIREQIEFANSVYNTILKYPIELDKPLSLEFDSEKKTYVKDNTELTNHWKTNTHYQVAQNYIALFQEKYPSENTITVKKELEVEARLKTKKELDRRFKRLLAKTDNDYFTTYLDTITRAFGPHTSYLPPEEKEDFDINMSGQLEGIGAILREDDGFIKVVRIIPGSASWRQGALKAEDIILKVGQNNESEEAVSIIETPVREAVKLIRGPKGSTVILTVKKPDGMIKTIPIQRDIVVIKSTYAKSGIFEVNNNKFGYISLPSFYRDFEDKNNRNAADDIKNALLSFNKNNTDGMILDLRNNGGGSLKDAVDISGFFIPKGPVVQVSDSYNEKRTLSDTDNQTIYNKPLIVLVNAFSASASEIVSAALQDYKRAIIIGNQHTFGKGTVQQVVDLNRLFFQSQDLGFLKITIQEYFRINGQSTQFKGVIPDIIYPSAYDYLDVGEKELKYAFKGSKTSPSDYTLWHINDQKKSTIIKNSYQRLENNPVSKVITNYNTFMKTQRDNSYRSIRLSDLWNNLQNVKEQNKTLNEITVEKQFSTFSSIEPSETFNEESEKEEYDKWVNAFDNDFLLNEAFLVLSQMTTPAINNVD